MKSFIDKLSSYNIFNYLLPGVVYLHSMQELFVINSKSGNPFSWSVMGYFIGLVISRIGSLIVEPILVQTFFVKKDSYEAFVEASKKENRIGLFSEIANSYRTLTSLSLTSLASFLIFYPRINLHEKDKVLLIAITSLLGVLFAFSYRKQTNYIQKQIRLTQE